MSTIRALKTKSSPTTITFGELRLSYEMMPAATFCALPDNPKQRETELRSDKPHLRTIQPEHLHVAVYRDHAGTMTKIDGHTRAFTWEKRNVMPGMLFALVYEETHDGIDTVAEQRRLYDSYDSRLSAKTSTDETQSALKIHGIKLKTDWLRRGSFGNALAMAALFIPDMPRGSKPADKETRIAKASKALTLLDSLAPTQGKLKSGFLAGVLMFLFEYGADGLETVQAYLDGTGGLEQDGKKNAHSRLQEFLNVERAAGSMAGLENNKRQAVRVYELLDCAMRNPAVGARVTVFNASAYAARVSAK